MKIFMDDMRLAEHGFQLARTVDEALNLVRQNQVEVLSLDYNMGFPSKNGYDFVTAFCREGLFANVIIVHSNDVIGAKKMIERLELGKELGEISKEIVVKRASGYWI